MYTDGIRPEFVKASQFRINRRKLEIAKFVPYAECDSQKGVTVVAKPENKTINISHTGSDGEKIGKTGKISCVNGFTAEIRVINPHP